MTPQEMQHLAELLQTVPGIKSLDLKDVRRLALGQAHHVGQAGDLHLVTAHRGAMLRDEYYNRAPPGRLQYAEEASHIFE